MLDVFPEEFIENIINYLDYEYGTVCSNHDPRSESALIFCAVFRQFSRIRRKIMHDSYKKKREYFKYIWFLVFLTDSYRNNPGTGFRTPDQCMAPINIIQPSREDHLLNVCLF